MGGEGRLSCQIKPQREAGAGGGSAENRFFSRSWCSAEGVDEDAARQLTPSRSASGGDLVFPFWLIATCLSLRLWPLKHVVNVSS